MPRFGGILRGRQDELTLAILLLVGAVLAAAPRTSAAPVIHNILSTGNVVFDNMFGWTFELSDTYRENADLRYQVAELSLASTQMEEVRLQNERFRALLEWEEERRSEILTGAEVIAHGDGRLSFAVTISVGLRDSVRRNQAVVTADGLVGRIDREPGIGTSIVSLLNDPANAAAAVVQRSRVHGVFQFVGDEGRLLHVLQAADVLEGDVIISSGLGGVYPEGLMIGKVVSVTDDPDGVSKMIVVTTTVALDRLEEVFILRSGGGG
ncbi:rod shape-determining protein MreC [Gemmatimonadota bacterium]